MGAIAGYNAGLFLAAPNNVSMTDEAMTNSGDNATFNISNQAHQAWDYTTAFTVQVELDDCQTVSITGSPSGGTFTLTFNGHTTTGIAFNAAASAVQSALVALTGVGSGQVTVTGSAGGPWLVDWTGTLGYASQPLMTTDGSGLTGGSTPASHVAHTQTGQTWTTTSSGFTINYAIGQVVFATPYIGNNNTPAIRIHAGHYFPISFLAGVKEIDGTATGTPLETTTMQNPPSPWKTYIAGVNGATLKLSTIWVNGGTFLAHMSADDILLLKAYPNSANAQRYQGYGKMTSDSLKSAQNAVNTEDIDFVINGKLYYVAS